MANQLFKDDGDNPSPDSPYFDLWLRKKIVAFSEQDWDIMKSVYQRAVANRDIAHNRGGYKPKKS